MSVVHLTDVQLAQFTACGLIVVDGDLETCEMCNGHDISHDGDVGSSCYACNGGANEVAPELWRKLTVECDGSDTCPAVVHIFGCYRSTPADEANEFVGMLPVVTLTATCPYCRGNGVDPVDGDEVCTECLGNCKVELGRFTIQLLPIPAIGDCPGDTPHLCLNDTQATLVDADGEETAVALDPLPQPGQWAVQFEAAP